MTTSSLRKALLPMVVAAAATAACGGRGTQSAGTTPPPVTPSGTGLSPTDSVSPTLTQASCRPSGTHVSLTAKDFQFDTRCLAAPAGKAFTIEYHNEDAGVTHNLSISSSSGDPTFSGKPLQGVATQSYSLDALQPGTYQFQCDFHPSSMNGILVVS